MKHLQKVSMIIFPSNVIMIYVVCWDCFLDFNDEVIYDDDYDDDDEFITAHFALKSFVRLVFASVAFTKILKSPGSSRRI